VIVRFLAELSANLLDWHVNVIVFDVAVSGVVGGVKLAVYSAVPVMILKLLMYPFQL
jgi:hypothetical protein